jgi:hypothetical protein
MLLGVDGVAPDDVWAVGWRSARYHPMAVAMHWNGRRWRSAHLPYMGTSTSLRGVVALASDDVWAVGGLATYPNAKNLIMHWYGEEWTRVDAPPSDDYRDLERVSALAPDDVVASGRYCVAEQCIAQTIHWDGEEWSPVEDEPLSLVQQVGGASDDALAIGNSAPFEHPLVQHWDGTSWEEVRLPRSAPDELLLSDLSVLRSGRGLVAANGRGLQDPYVLRWSGSRLRSDDLPSSVAIARAVSASSSDEAWLIGEAASEESPTTVRWDGEAWSAVPSPISDLPGYRAELWDVATLGPADAWAVGWLDDDEGTSKRLAMHWDGETWTVVEGPGTASGRG